MLLLTATPLLKTMEGIKLKDQCKTKGCKNTPMSVIHPEHCIAHTHDERADPNQYNNLFYIADDFGWWDADFQYNGIRQE